MTLSVPQLPNMPPKRPGESGVSRTLKIHSLLKRERKAMAGFCAFSYHAQN